jgi:hypothetical protein
MCVIRFRNIYYADQQIYFACSNQNGKEHFANYIFLNLKNFQGTNNIDLYKNKREYRDRKLCHENDDGFKLIVFSDSDALFKEGDSYNFPIEIKIFKRGEWIVTYSSRQHIWKSNKN